MTPQAVIIHPMIPAWLTYALLAAAFAAVVALLGKIGLQGIDSTLATTLRSLIMTFFLLLVAGGTGVLGRLKDVAGKPMLFIAASGVAGALSWLFMFKALASPGGDVSRVAPIDKLSMPLGVVAAVLILGERPTAINWVGLALVIVGVYLATVRGS